MSGCIHKKKCRWFNFQPNLWVNCMKLFWGIGCTLGCFKFHSKAAQKHYLFYIQVVPAAFALQPLAWLPWVQTEQIWGHPGSWGIQDPATPMPVQTSVFFFFCLVYPYRYPLYFGPPHVRTIVILGCSLACSSSTFLYKLLTKSPLPICYFKLQQTFLIKPQWFAIFKLS